MESENFIDSLNGIKVSAVSLLVRLNGDDPGDVLATMQEYTTLVDRKSR